MDTQNDNQNASRSVKWLEEYYKLSPRKSHKDTDALSYIAEKTSRITAVTLKLADTMDAECPVRTELERTSLGLVKDAVSFGYSNTARERFFVGGAALSALLRTATLSGSVSELNANILLHEIQKLMKTVAEVGMFEGRMYVAHTAMSVDLPPDLYAEEQYDTRRPLERHIKDERVFRKTQYAPAPTSFMQRTQERDTGEASVRTQERAQAIQKDRRAVILGLLQKKDRINVKDVAQVIRDCSEKTIQRELAALVAQGVLKREGERRWSTYSLI